jgi:hypothetical protein
MTICSTMSPGLPLDLPTALALKVS